MTALLASDGTMLDLLYIIGTLAFFALMLAYVAGCEYLGRATHAGEPGTGPQP